MDRKAGLTVLGLALAVLLVSSSGVAAQSGSGFVAYNIDVTTPSGQHSVVVNETVGPSAKVGFSDMILQIVGSQQNLTYSRLVNSSSVFFPYLSAMTTQALAYSGGAGSGLDVNFSAAGTTTVSFQGSQYTLTKYSFSASGTYGNMSVGVNGTLEAFPSTLLYSADVSGHNISVQAVIQATDLQLAQPVTASPSTTVVGAGIGIGGFALAAALLVRRRGRKSQSQGEKPLHWVD